MTLPACEGGAPIRPKDRFLVFGQPAIGEAEIRGVVDSMERRWIGTGPKVQQFEREFAAYRQARHAAAVGSCTAALHLSMMAIGIGPGDEVITTPMTFCSSVNAIIHTGATPVLVDCERDTMNIDAAAIERKVTPRTKAILPVHFCGRPCDMDTIMGLAHAHRLRVIEDCAHAIETMYSGRAAGTIGDIGCFSFYATKNLTTAEGGMILTGDEELAARIKVLALHGLSKDAWKRFSDSGYQHYEVSAAGFKYNMTDIQAAIGLAQLRRIEDFAVRRNEIWAIYDRAFADLPCLLPPPPADGTLHARHLYTPLLQLERLRVGRDDILNALNAENIGAGVHYVAVHRHGFYERTYDWTAEQFPNADFVSERTLSLPLSPALDDQDVDDVVRAFRRILLHYAI
ncbi:MAG: DegT/DnrJ/EryC1/StrS family aminotransferase [Alphaproteobacteria bacterium]|nr:DegT/DnrJ/EryC1/StrS family aminotransferase [Alphaproteobacteria bacterium]